MIFKKKVCNGDLQEDGTPSLIGMGYTSQTGYAV